MKFLKVFSLVFLGHALLVGSFLLQPGCQSIDKQWEEYRKEKRSVNVPPEVLAQEQGLPPDAEEVDPAFNQGAGAGGDTPKPKVRATPTRPTGEGSPTQPLDLEPSEPLFNPGLADGFNDVPETSPTSGYVPYTVQRGDTLWGLAKEYNVPFTALLEANGMTRDSQLRVGQEILVPADYDEAVVSADGAAAEPEPAAGTTIYEVRRGDTLSEIAVRAGTSVSRIKSLNNMGTDRIRIGQKLIVPGEIAAADEEGAVSRVDYDPAEYTATHTVRSGETVSGIAYRYGMSVPELLAVNELDDPRRLRAGAELSVKPAPAGAKAEDDPSPAPTLRPAGTGDRTPLPGRGDPAGEEGADDGAEPEEEAAPAAPEIVPEASPVEPEPIEDEEGFGAEIFRDFEGVEEVPVERRDNDGS